jgi:Zn-dependent protease with chaperone function
MMDLFLAQEESRQRSGGMFTLAMCLMAGVFASVHLLVALCSGTVLSDVSLHQRLIVWTLPATLGVLLVGVVVRAYALRFGGASVAKELGGRRLHPATQDAGEKLVLEMVEELSIAGGLPIPEVWLLDEEPSINAFAAGRDASSAVIGLTRGALERLTTEELRAVLLHEFSHILSGDMRLKFEMLVWVQGILFLSWAGRLMIASDSPVGGGFWGGKAVPAGRGSLAGRRAPAQDLDGESQGRSLLGLLMMLVGLVTSLFGRFLQGAIARDTEFSADATSAGCLASAMPVVSALRKIGGLPQRSYLNSPTAPESGHLFFGQAWSGVVSTFFPTHPTLEERILRLHPQWNGDFLASVARKVLADTNASAQAGGTVEAPAPEMSAAARAAAAIGARKREKVKAKEKADTLSTKGYPAANLGFLGTAMLPSQLTAAAVLRRSIKPEWLKHTQSLEGAKGLLQELMKSPSHSSHELAAATASQMLLLLDFSMPMLRRLNENDYYVLMRRCRKELLRSEEIDVVRFLLLHVVRRRLGIALGVREIDPIVAEDLPAVWGPCQVLVSLMMRFGAPTQTARNSAHAAAWASLGYENPPGPRESVNVVEMVDALEALAKGSPFLKKRVLVACGLAATYQGSIPEREMALLRMFADAMGSPVPHLSTKSME